MTDRPGRLAKAAERLFAEKVYAAVAIRDVATAAGLPAGAVFYHYRRKADLATAAARRHHAGIQDAFGAVLQAGDRDRGDPERLASVLAAEGAPLARHVLGVARLAMDLASEGEDAIEARTACLRAIEAFEDGVRRSLTGDGIDPQVASSVAARVSMAWLGASVMAKARDAGWWEEVALPEVVSILREAQHTPPVEPAPPRRGGRGARKTRPAPGNAPIEKRDEPRPSREITRTKSRQPGPVSADGKAEAGPATPRGSATPADVLNAVGSVLEEAGTPLGRRELLGRVEQLLLAKLGLGMPGRNPFENLLTIISKDRSRTFINLTPHGIWIRARPYAPLEYAPGDGWRRRRAPGQ